MLKLAALATAAAVAIEAIATAISFAFSFALALTFSLGIRLGLLIFLLHRAWERTLTAFPWLPVGFWWRFKLWHKQSTEPVPDYNNFVNCVIEAPSVRD